MKTQVWVYVVVVLLSVGAGVAIAGTPTNDRREPTIPIPATSDDTTPATAPTTAVEPEPTLEPAATESTAPVDTATESTTTEPDADPTGIADTSTSDTPTTSTDPTTNSTTATATTAPASEPAARGDLDVAVANAGARAGFARATGDAVQQIGYVDVRSLDASENTDMSVVFAADGLQVEAERLAVDVGIDPTLVFPLDTAPEVPGLTDEDLIVYLGPDAPEP